MSKLISIFFRNIQKMFTFHKVYTVLKLFV